jgi:hypothetical protein
MQSTDEFIHSQNVANFKRRLNVELDRNKRKVLLTLLAEEEAKLQNTKKGEATQSRSIQMNKGLAP